MTLDHKLVPHDIPDYLGKMRSMYEDLFSGGKGYRGALVFAIAQEMGLSDQESQTLSRSIEYIHNSSLLHDDFVDEAPLRRGKEAAWKKYGGGYAILGGDYLLAKVIKNLCGLGSLDLIEYTSATIVSLVEGEWLQDACHQRADVSLDEMDRVHKLKTSSLFSWCFKAPALLTDPQLPASEVQRLDRIGEIFGLLLQRSDDLLDYNIRNAEGKAHFKDIPAGYFNSFTLFMLKDVPEDQAIKAYSCETLEDFQCLFSGSVDLLKSLEDFDKINQGLLDELKNEVLAASCFSSDFKDFLLESSEKIYWRARS